MPGSVLVTPGIRPYVCPVSRVSTHVVFVQREELIDVMALPYLP